MNQKWGRRRRKKRKRGSNQDMLRRRCNDESRRRGKRSVMYSHDINSWFIDDDNIFLWFCPDNINSDRRRRRSLNNV